MQEDHPLAAHVGQIGYLTKQLKGRAWETLSIPRVGCTGRRSGSRYYRSPGTRITEANTPIPLRWTYPNARVCTGHEVTGPCVEEEEP